MTAMTTAKAKAGYMLVGVLLTAFILSTWATTVAQRFAVGDF